MNQATLTATDVSLDARTVNASALEYVLGLCLKSARAIPESKSSWTPSDGDAKSALEVVSHIVEVNHNLNCAIKGQPLSEAELSNILSAITDYPGALKALEQSGKTLIETIKNASAAALHPHLNDWLGPKSPGRLMALSQIHLVYHWGQLCYLQTLWDDQENHFLK